MTVIDVPVDRITAEARQVRFGHTVLSLIAWVLVGLGRLAYVLLSGLWFVLAWTATAVKVGWQEARADAERRKRANGQRT